jgi:hypothetical protein
MKSNSPIPRKSRVVDARKGSKIVTILVDVRRTGRSHQVITRDQRVRVKGEGVLFIWKLGRGAEDWKFFRDGVAIQGDSGRQFINPYAFRSGDRVSLFDRNTKRGQFRYNVSLVRRGNPALLIHEDPIIENEGDGRSG